MSCSPFDLKDFFFDELAPAERQLVENHMAACSDCRQELSTLALTRSALLSVADEEPSRRIAFVSDKVFEPRWWQRVWRSGPQMAFASCCLLAAAIVFHAMQAPVVTTANQLAPANAGTVATVDNAAVQAEVSKQVAAAVKLAVAEAEDRQAARLLGAVNIRINELERGRSSELLAIKDYLERLHKERLMVRRTAFEPLGVSQ